MTVYEPASSEEDRADVEFDATIFLEEARRKAQAKLTTTNAASDDGPQDLLHLLRSANALITTNEEIWERCKEHRCALSGEILTFCRHSISAVRCVLVGNDTVSITIQPEVASQSFGPPPTIPSDLLDLITLLESERGGTYEAVFPDYRLYLEKHVGLLNEAVLTPVLMKFKEHLESLHVFLGSIESWLLAPSHHAEFLQDLTGTQVSIPTEKTVVQCNGRCQSPEEHSPLSVCSRCNKLYQSHNHSYDPHTALTRHICPVHTSHHIRNGCFTYYPKGEVQTLLSVPHSQGKLDAMFSLDDESDQRKLKALKEYISCN